MAKLITKVLFGGLISFLIIAVIVMTIVSSQKSSANTTTLELVAILHRHGFRTPTETYKADPYQEDAWPVTWGQLLNKGKQQLYKLGKTFRGRYQSFVKKYSSKTITVRTSDLDRCHMSAASLLAAWFPPEDNDEIWNEQLAWQPIPIHSVPYNEDNMLAQNKTCPRYKLELKKVLAELKANETDDDKALYKYLTENTGQEVNQIRQIEIFYTTLTIEKLYGFELPAWTKQVYPEQMKKRAILSVASYQWNTLMKRLSAGPFINEVLEQFKKKSGGESEDLKLLIYSAHDSTISSVWRLLDFEGIIMPDFGSSLIFELHKSSDQYLVKMFHLNNTELTEPDELQIPKCPSPCTLDKLINITEELRPTDWEKECTVA